MNIVQELDNFQSLPQAFFRISALKPNNLVYEQALLVEDGSGAKKDPAELKRRWIKRTFKEVSTRIDKIAGYLQSIGVKKGDKIAIISNSRAEWLEADMAAMINGAIIVSIYQSLLPQDIGYILYDSQVQYVFAENQSQLDKLLELEKNPTSIPATEEREATLATIKIKHVITFEETNAAENVISLDQVLASQSAGQIDTYKSLTRDDIACLVYTSGTTGPPKGVMQSHGNHLSNVRQAFQADIYHEDSEIVLVLPLAHSFAKLMGYIAFVTPAVVKFAAVVSKKSSKLNPESLTRDILESNSSLVPLVPRMLEKMKDGVERRAAGTNLLAKLLTAMIKASLERYQCKLEGKNVKFKTSLVYFLTGILRKIIKKKIFGTKFKYAVSGGAKLSHSVAVFFNAIDIEVLEGYGLTETCVATNVNRSGKNQIGTVGPVLSSDIEQKIAADGEILFRGPNIAKGYYNREAATKASWDQEGWFHTGDIGTINQSGSLSITGRKKELIVTSGGKKIAPDFIEHKLKAIKLVSQAVMVGEGRSYCIALLTLDDLQVKESGLKLEDIHSKIWNEVEVLNKSLASFESIKKIQILEEDFTVENGFLTPTFKVKRSAVIKKFENLVEGLYSK